MINLATFSLGKTAITIERYTGSFTDGIYSYTLDSSIETFASVQPYSTIEPEQVQDPATGEWVKEILLMYTQTEVFQNDSSEANAPRDLIVANGKKYKPIRVEPWQHLGLQHYRVLLARYDGD